MAKKKEATKRETKTTKQRLLAALDQLGKVPEAKPIAIEALQIAVNALADDFKFPRGGAAVKRRAFLPGDKLVVKDSKVDVWGEVLKGGTFEVVKVGEKFLTVRDIKGDEVKAPSAVFARQG